MLSREPKDYTVGDILRITEGSMAPVACLEGAVNSCERRDYCQTLFVWEGLYKTVNEYLESITVQDILDKGQGLKNDYII